MTRVVRPEPVSARWTKPTLSAAALRASSGRRTARRTAPRRAPFVVLVCGLLAGGLCVLVVLNTASAAAELRRHDVAVANAALAEDLEQLRSQLAASEAPGALAAAAAKLGMVPNGIPAFLTIAAEWQGHRARQPESRRTRRGAGVPTHRQDHPDRLRRPARRRLPLPDPDHRAPARTSPTTKPTADADTHADAGHAGASARRASMTDAPPPASAAAARPPVPADRWHPHRRRPPGRPGKRRTGSRNGAPSARRCPARRAHLGAGPTLRPAAAAAPRPTYRPHPPGVAFSPPAGRPTAGAAADTGIAGSARSGGRPVAGRRSGSAGWIAG